MFKLEKNSLRYLKFSQGDFLKISQKFYHHYKTRGWGFIVVNTTFNNISVILWQSVLLVEETGVPGENHRPVASH
jgi:hypothetical protein